MHCHDRRRPRPHGSRSGIGIQAERGRVDVHETGSAPTRRTALPDPAKVSHGNPNSSPAPIPSARRSKSSPAVPPFTPTHMRSPTNPANSASSAATSQPWGSCPAQAPAPASAPSVSPITGFTSEIMQAPESPPRPHETHAPLPGRASGQPHTSPSHPRVTRAAPTDATCLAEAPPSKAYRGTDFVTTALPATDTQHSTRTPYLPAHG